MESSFHERRTLESTKSLMPLSLAEPIIPAETIPRCQLTPDNWRVYTEFCPGSPTGGGKCEHASKKPVEELHIYAFRTIALLMILFFQSQRLYSPASQPQGLEMTELSILLGSSVMPYQSVTRSAIVLNHLPSFYVQHSVISSQTNLQLQGKPLEAHGLVLPSIRWYSFFEAEIMFHFHQAKDKLLRLSNSNPTFKLHVLEPTGIRVAYLGRYKPYLTLRQHQRNRDFLPTTQNSAITNYPVEPSHLPQKLRTNRHYTAGPGENWSVGSRGHPATYPTLGCAAPSCLDTTTPWLSIRDIG
ncbi:uncharacterized protein CLUP02_05493 [Colletotrichum lupini]|uniref:Uncharacterized protein n=1 Tax=Colletotrichum lupini TaxID=145971 RepID=A0A9Q8SP42_9PEZI|nr:uncharacterized protein CLUP02_05493 [Colletotrichum lupini]UQC80012.1 hypothetical protein CLUP02_05493 [Colletotrichum lupini]